MVMAYESRRERRLKAEAERRQRLRSRLSGFLTVVVFLTLFFLMTFYLGRQRIDSSSGDDGAANQQGKKAEEQSVEQPKNLAQQAVDGLEAQIASVNNDLGISDRTNLADLPSQTTTAVSIIDLSDKRRGSANYNGDTQFTSASLYKLFIAYLMAHDVETGRRTWQSLINGTTWQNCYTKMIVNSDNACPEAYLAANGYDKLNQAARDLGMSERTIFAVDNMRTTANDMAKLMNKLHNGELMSDDNRSMLYDLMARQQFRRGIPAGIASATVYDKVGWLDAIVNDVAIVHADQGDYILVIMTNGESWDYVARLASYINGVMASGG